MNFFEDYEAMHKYMESQLPKPTKAQRDLERIIKAKHAVADAKQKYESLVMDDALSEMILGNLMQAFASIDNAYGLMRKLVKQEENIVTHTNGTFETQLTKKEE